jgi:hypothetical protein
MPRGVYHRKNGKSKKSKMARAIAKVASVAKIEGTAPYISTISDITVTYEVSTGGYRITWRIPSAQR